MRNRVFLRRGEGVAPWQALAILLAVLALLASSLTFPWAASAAEESATPSTSPATSTTVGTPVNTLDDGGTGTSATTEPSTSATTSAQQRSTTSTRTAPRTAVPQNEVRTQTQQSGPRAVQPFAINNGIAVEITDIGHERDDDEDPLDTDTPLELGDFVEVHGTWDARNASPEPGDEFSIAFPDELQLTDTLDFDLAGGDGTIWGTCEVSVPDNVMNCVLSDAVENRGQEVHGTFFVYSQAVEYTTAETLYFDVNGQTEVPGELPGEGGIGDGQTIGDATKSGAFTPDRTGIRWSIDIPGTDLAALDEDGTGSVTLSDELSDNMQLCEDGRLNATLLAGRPGNMQEIEGGVSVTQEDGAGSPISIDIANGAAFQEDMLYRIQYTSCTTSGEVDLPEEGDDDVVYTNNVGIGEGSVGVGVGQDWRPATGPSKWGNWVSGTRYTELSWTVQVPGTVFAADANDTVTIDETLTGDHVVCDAGLRLSVREVDHLPGPGGGSPASRDVTDEFTITDNADPDDTAFSVTLTPIDTASFDPDKYYRVSYRTCVTTELVSDPSNSFSNSADVNGTVVNTTVTGPAYTGSKAGSYNTEPTVVGGEEQPAGTTVDWGLEIPGYDLEGLTENAVITDTFSDTLTVCEVGDDIKDNLNLSVMARDFLGDGSVNEERDLTEDTEVVRTAEGLQFVLPMDEGDYNRETRYFLDYTLCTSSGGVDSRGTTYSNTAEWAGQEITRSVEQRSGGGGTGQGVSRGSFSLEKDIHQFSEEFPEDTVFTVQVEEFEPGVDPESGTAEDTYTVEVQADGSPVSGVNVRGEGWTIRLTEINLPHGNGVYFEPGVFQETEGVELRNNDTEAIVEIQRGTNVAVELRNRAHEGTARITKNVVDNTGGELTGDERFVIQAHIDTGVEGSGTELREFTLRDGQFYDLGDLPVGAEVTFSEVLPGNTDYVTWAEPVFEPETLVIGEDQSANAVTVTNEANITEGSFEVSKMIQGSEANNPAVPDAFEVNATWTDADGNPQEDTLTVPSSGESVPFPVDLPGGTEVTLTEVVPEDGNGLSWGVPAYSGDVTSTSDGSAVVTIGQEPGEVTVRNVVDSGDGTLRLTKQVSGEAADAVGDAEFTVDARWNTGDGWRTETLTVSEGETTPLGVDIPHGTEVTFEEIGLPEIAGLDWGTPTWGTDPTGESWLTTHANGTATGIVTDEQDDGALITLTNEAGWQSGSVGFEKFLFDGPDPVPAIDSDLPDGTDFRVRIDDIEPALPAGTDFPGVGYTITLNSDNGFSWQSDEVLPTGTVITFSEVDPAPLDGTDWARPFYYVAADAGEPEDRNTVEIVAGEQAEVEIRNRPIPTTDVVIDKFVTGSKGEEVAGDRSSTFEVTATWSDEDDEQRSCILDVRPDGSMSATSDCEAVTVGERVQFPLDTEITFIETAADTDVSNVDWGEVSWSVADGSADIDEIDGEPAGVVVTLTGGSDERVTLELENEANLAEGTFGISKQISGPEEYNDSIPEFFQVDATWTDADGNPQEEALQVPSDGTTVEFPHDLPGHTEVTLTEVVPADENGLAWSVPGYGGDVDINDDGSAVVTIDQEEIHVTVDNFVDTNDGTLRVTKQVTGEAAEAVGDEEFTVEASWQDGSEFGEQLLTVSEGESTPLGHDLPEGTQVTFTEIGLPEIAGVEWTDVSWGTNPVGDSWLRSNPDGTATGIVSDDPTEGRLITLTNEAQWMDGSVGFEKLILDDNGENPVPATEADLPDIAEFDVRIDGIDPALPADVDFPAVGETITLDSGNDWSWESGEVLPRDTVVTFSEVDPAPLDGTDWGQPSYHVTADAGEPGERDTVQIVPGDHAEVEIHNRPIPTTDVDIDKVVTGPKGGQVAQHESTTFQVTATWTDVDDVERSCILDVTPDGGMTPTVECDAVVVGDRVQFPTDTEITFVETGAHTDVSNVNWGDVAWTVNDGNADATEIDGEPTGTVVTLTGDEPVSLGLENETSSRGLIFLPIPIPIPPFDPGSSTPPGPDSPTPPGPERPGDPGEQGDGGEPSDPVKPQKPSQTAPQKPVKPSKPSNVGHDGAPGKPAPKRPGKPDSLAVTGANVVWLGGAALALIAGGTWLALRNRRDTSADQVDKVDTVDA